MAHCRSAPRPQVYSADGEFLFKFGSHGEGNGQFNAPTGVAVDSNGNIIVADWGNSRIQVWVSVLPLCGGGGTLLLGRMAGGPGQVAVLCPACLPTCLGGP